MNNIIMAPLTPLIKGPAIVLRLSGEDLSPVFKLFSIKNPEHGRAVRASYKSVSGLRDEVILTYFQAPRSYTGENVLEISFHGNPLIVSMAMDELAALGIRMAEPGEFTKRAHLNGKMSLVQAEAVEAVISAKTAAGVETAGALLRGELDETFATVKNELYTLLAGLEAEIDFSDESEADNSQIFVTVDKIMNTLGSLVDNYVRSRAQLYGLSVVIAGAPNAGKSTLFNLLLGEERAIVTSEEGTTRDTLTEQLVFSGVSFQLTDTAGIRQSSSEAENAGILRARKVIDDADFVIIALDLTKDVPEDVKELLSKAEERGWIIVGTKSDLPSLAHSVQYRISSKTGEGVDEIRRLIRERALRSAENCGLGLVNERQMRECKAALTELTEIKENVLTEDLVAYHIKNALLALTRATGEDLAEETLDRLFSGFCIGK